jgi:hypothetical protein
MEDTMRNLGLIICGVLFSLAAFADSGWELFRPNTVFAYHQSGNKIEINVKGQVQKCGVADFTKYQVRDVRCEGDALKMKIDYKTSSNCKQRSNSVHKMNVNVSKTCGLSSVYVNYVIIEDNIGAEIAGTRL